MRFAVKCVVFDFDGVLVDSNAIKRAAYFDVLGRREIPAVVVARCLDVEARGDRRDVIACVMNRMGVVGDAAVALTDACVREYGEVCETRIAACPERPGASRVLRELAISTPIYINSATPEDALVAVIARRGWTSYFRAVRGRPASKTENLERVMREERLPASSLLFVGDRQADFVAAEVVGCQFLGLESDESDFAEGVPRLVALSDLPEFVQPPDGS